VRYITPESILALRLKGQTRPNWKKALICFLAIGPCERIIRQLQARPLKIKVLWGMEVTDDKPFTYEADIDGEPVLIAVRCNWGGPQAAILVEEMASLGVQTLLGLGAAGAIDETLKLGAQIAASEAPALDGTSKAYTTEPSHPAPSLLKGAQALGAQPVKIATHDAFYRETDADLAAWQAAGLQAINMESAPFYAAATACNINALWLGSISDKLSPNSHTWAEDRNPMTDETLRIALQLLTQKK
jgi:uridine phosphorylase